MPFLVGVDVLKTARQHQVGEAGQQLFEVDAVEIFGAVLRIFVAQSPIRNPSIGNRHSAIATRLSCNISSCPSAARARASRRSAPRAVRAAAARTPGTATLPSG